MPSITKKQYNDWSAKCSNGFALDLQRYLVWGEKQAVKAVDLAEDVKLRATVEYSSHRRTETGAVWGNFPTLHLAVYRKTSTDMWASSGMGVSIPLTVEPQPRKVWNVLAQFTAQLDDAKLMELYQTNHEAFKNPFIM